MKDQTLFADKGMLCKLNKDQENHSIAVGTFKFQHKFAWLHVAIHNQCLATLAHFLTKKFKSRLSQGIYLFPVSEIFVTVSKGSMVVNVAYITNLAPPVLYRLLSANENLPNFACCNRDQLQKQAKYEHFPIGQIQTAMQSYQKAYVVYVCIKAAISGKILLYYTINFVLIGLHSACN